MQAGISVFTQLLVERGTKTVVAAECLACRAAGDVAAGHGGRRGAWRKAKASQAVSSAAEDPH